MTQPSKLPPMLDFMKFLNDFMSLPTYVMFNTTYNCGNGCPHCHYSCSTDYDLNKFMPVNDIHQILDDLKQHSVDGIAFSGGEITNIERINPNYIKKLVFKSMLNGFPTTVMTNGSWADDESDSKEKDYLLNIFRDIYEVSYYQFHIQMSFDSYHKNCIENAHTIISELDKRITRRPDSKIKYPFILTGFNHEPEFKNNLKITECENLEILNHSVWDLNPVGRAKTNNLPNWRDTKKEFDDCFGDNILEKMIWTPIIMSAPDKKCMILTFDSDGFAELTDAHNYDNFNKFKTPYKEQETNKIKPIKKIKTELAMQLVNYFYGNDRE